GGERRSSWLFCARGDTYRCTAAGAIPRRLNTEHSRNVRVIPHTVSITKTCGTGTQEGIPSTAGLAGRRLETVADSIWSSIARSAGIHAATGIRSRGARSLADDAGATCAEAPRSTVSVL